MANKLALSTQIERPVIEIDGEAYPLKTMQTMGLLEQKRFQAQQKRLQQLLDIDPNTTQETAAGFDWDRLSEDDVDELAEVLQEIAPLLLPDAPADKLKALTDGQRLQIFTVFSEIVKDETS